MNDEILLVLSERLRGALKSIGTNYNITEIRLRAYKKVIVFFGTEEIKLDLVITLEDILQILVAISKNSIYAIQNDINNGFVVIKGGHRIGISGEVVMQEGKIKNIKNISSMNIRIARQIIGSADKVMPYIMEDGFINNTLIISPPGCGKTTILRDIVRQLSNKENMNISLIDERGEIAAVCQGIANLDVGIRTDIMSNVPKYIGIELLVRSMSPKVIATDEIGSKEDIDAIKYASTSGVSMIFTMHGRDLEDVWRKNEINELIKSKIFNKGIFLSNRNGIGTIEKIYSFITNKQEVV